MILMCNAPVLHVELAKVFATLFARAARSSQVTETSSNTMNVGWCLTLSSASCMFLFSGNASHQLAIYRPAETRCTSFSSLLEMYGQVCLYGFLSAGRVWRQMAFPFTMLYEKEILLSQYASANFTCMSSVVDNCQNCAGAPPGNVEFSTRMSFPYTQPAHMFGTYWKFSSAYLDLSNSIEP